MNEGSVLIGRNIHLTNELKAKEIHVSSSGVVLIVTKSFIPDTQLPQFTVEYLEYICSRHYFGGKSHQHAIADIMLLNNVLRLSYYDSFYKLLEENLASQKITIISSELF